ncbi:hypothetical protein [Streptomyces sp. NPDC017529]|uniref:hypothetical protein n=1 Tax=Streptomyces sp. NPDC017529 TaxID=3365000 RepID=UPI0037B0FFAD
MSRTTAGPEWSGDMLTKPELVEAFSSQLRGVLNAQAAYVAEIRRDAEAMWKANKPEGYNSFEAWWRHRWVTGPFAEIQEHIEKAAKLTFDLEARYRKGRHEIPAARKKAALEKQQAKQAPQVTAGTAQAVPPKPVEPPTVGAAGAGDGFLSLVSKERSA